MHETELSQQTQEYVYLTGRNRGQHINLIKTSLCTPKCDCCLHKEICSKKTIYINTCQNIKNILGGAAQDFISVSVSCKYFISEER